MSDQTDPLLVLVEGRPLSANNQLRAKYISDAWKTANVADRERAVFQTALRHIEWAQQEVLGRHRASMRTDVEQAHRLALSTKKGE